MTVPREAVSCGVQPGAESSQLHGLIRLLAQPDGVSLGRHSVLIPHSHSFIPQKDGDCTRATGRRGSSPMSTLWQADISLQAVGWQPTAESLSTVHAVAQLLTHQPSPHSALNVPYSRYQGRTSNSNDCLAELDENRTAAMPTKLRIMSM